MTHEDVLVEDLAEFLRLVHVIPDTHRLVGSSLVDSSTLEEYSYDSLEVSIAAPSV